MRTVPEREVANREWCILCSKVTLTRRPSNYLSPNASNPQEVHALVSTAGTEIHTHTSLGYKI